MAHEFVVKDHRLEGVPFVESPNQSARPADAELELLIIHNISLPPGKFGTGCVEQLFCNLLDFKAHDYFAQLRDLRVSAHLFIDRKGAITQFVPFNKKAWHAGASCYQGRSECNDFSVGIEMEGTDHEEFMDPQYATLAAVTRALCSHYPKLDHECIVGHSDVAPDRKTDPGPHFDWRRYRALLNPQI